MQTRRRLARQRSDRRGKIILLAVWGLMLIGIGGYQLLRQGDVAREQQTLCRVDGEISRETALILDATDQLSASQRQLIGNELQRLLSSALPDERFSLYIIDDQAVATVPRIVVCNPGNGQDQSALFANKRRLKAQWQTQFVERLLVAAESPFAGQSARQSPIMETIQHVAANSLYHSSAEHKRLILASDLLQHTPELSHYRAGGPSLDTPYLAQVKPRLSGVDVEILYLWRKQARARQHPGHLRFWEQYLRQASGKITRIEMVN